MILIRLKLDVFIFCGLLQIWYLSKHKSTKAMLGCLIKAIVSKEISYHMISKILVLTFGQDETRRVTEKFKTLIYV